MSITIQQSTVETRQREDRRLRGRPLRKQGIHELHSMQPRTEEALYRRDNHGHEKDRYWEIQT